MERKNKYYVLGPYVFLLLLAGLGYVLEFKVVLIVVMALSTALGATLLQKIYDAIFRKASMRDVSRVSPYLFLSAGVFLLAGAIVSYFSSKDIGLSGVPLGLAVYCFQSFILEKKA